MKLTKSQQNELEVWEYFMPDNCKWLPKTGKDIEMFFEWSEQGKHKDKLRWNYNITEHPYFQGLVEGKRWAGIHWQMYEDGVLDGTMPYFTILGGNDKIVYKKWWQIWRHKYRLIHNPPPRSVVNQMKREMFTGIDAEVIENCYQRILKEWTGTK